MTDTGWRITPLGWIALAVVAGFGVYLIGKYLRHIPIVGQKNKE